MAYSVSSLAKHWNCSRQHIYNLISDHNLKTFSIGIDGRGIRISDEEVERWERGEKTPTKTEASNSENQTDGGLPTGAMRALASARA